MRLGPAALSSLAGHVGGGCLIVPHRTCLSSGTAFLSAASPSSARVVPRTIPSPWLLFPMSHVPCPVSAAYSKYIHPPDYTTPPLTPIPQSHTQHDLLVALAQRQHASPMDPFANYSRGLFDPRQTFA